MSEDTTLSVWFGTDQERGIDKIVAEMIDDGKIEYLNRGPAIDGMRRYIIRFDCAYSIYLFGHRHGNNLIGYMTK